MQKLLKRISLVMVMLFAIVTAFSFIPVNKAKAAAIPKIRLVGAQKTEYRVGERVTFTVNASNYPGKVQYRAVLWHDETDTMRDLWTSGDRYYTNWVPSGPTTFTIGWPIFEPGTYRITVYVKRAYVANSRTALKGQNCDSYLPGIVFRVKSADVESIAPVSDVTVTRGDAEVLPKTVTLNMSGNTTKNAEVTWEDVDTTRTGEYTVSGKVEGTDKKAVVKVIVLPFEVTGVTASGSNTLTVTGTGLNKLTKEAVKLSGNAAASVASGADGRSATVTLEQRLLPNTNTLVNVADENGARDYTVINRFTVNSAVVNEAIYDDDRVNQFVTFKVNGESLNADLNYLALSGHSVTLVATDAVTGAAANIFSGGTNTSSTGLLTAPAPLGTYNIQAQVIRSGVATVSGKGVIKVTNLDAAVTALDKVTFVNGKTSVEQAYGTSTLSGDDFIMNNTILVAGERASVHMVKAVINGVPTELTASAGYMVKSSNPGVVSVAKDAAMTNTSILSANSTGTAVITVGYEGKTKDYTFTVTNTPRKLISVKPGVSRVDLIVNKSTSVKLETFDQYGDPFGVVSGKAADAIAPAVAVDEIAAVNAMGKALNAAFEVATNTADSIGSQVVSVQATANTGTGTIYFRGRNGAILGSLLINVTAVDNVAARKLEIIQTKGYSKDNVLDFGNPTDKNLKYGLANYNSQGIFSAYQSLDDYTVIAIDSNVVSVTKNATDFVITAKDISPAASKTTAVVIKNNKLEIVANFTVTVNYMPYRIASVQFKQSAKIDYAGKMLKAIDLFEMEGSCYDDVVKGITLNKSSESKVRIAEAMPSGLLPAYTEGLINVNDLYLDVDNNGYVSDGDVKLGSVMVQVASGATFNGSTTGVLEAGSDSFVNAGMLDRATMRGDNAVVIVSIWTGSNATTSVGASAVTISVK